MHAVSHVDDFLCQGILCHVQPVSVARQDAKNAKNGGSKGPLFPHWRSSRLYVELDGFLGLVSFLGLCFLARSTLGVPARTTRHGGIQTTNTDATVFMLPSSCANSSHPISASAAHFLSGNPCYPEGTVAQ